MTLALIANENMTVAFQSTGGPPDLVYGGDVGIDLTMVVPTLATKCKAGSKMIGTTGITITWPAETCPFISATHTHIAGAGSVATSAAKCRAQGAFVLRENDSGLCAGSWQPPTGPPVVCACNVSISSAGQSKAKGA